MEFEEEEEIKKSVLKQIFQSVFGVVALIGILYISGVHQFFLFRQTNPDIVQEEIKSQLDVSELAVPLTVFIITGPELYGSARSDENARGLVENASRIWNQANITLSIKNIYTLMMTEEEIRTLLDKPSLFVNTIEEFDTKTINVFLVGNLRGLNGIAFTTLGAVSVADYTTVFDFRALAHEVGHILGLNHVSGFRSDLMYQGANGSFLSPTEITQARGNIDY